MQEGCLRRGSSLDTLVLALCTDYSRRAELINSRDVSKRTLAELRYLNLKIFNASAEIAGEDFANIYISEIGFGTGYAKSRDEYISETTYKKYKSQIKENIARSLHLCD